MFISAYVLNAKLSLKSKLKRENCLETETVLLVTNLTFTQI